MKIRTRFNQFDEELDIPKGRQVCHVIAAGVVAAGAVAGAVVQSKAAKKAGQTEANAATAASDATLQATRETNDQNLAIYNNSLQNNNQYLTTGQEANSALASFMGLPNANAGNKSPSNLNPTSNGATLNPAAAGTNATVGTPSTTGTNGKMTVQGTASALTSGATATPGYATTNAAGQQVDANGNVLGSTAATGTSTTGTTNDAGIVQTGASQDQLDSAYNSTTFGQGTQTFTPSDLTLDPSYQFRLQQGQQANKAALAATGMLQSGAGAKAINDYAQNAASTEYAAANDRYVTNQNNLYNRLAGLSNSGQVAANTNASTGSAASSNMSNVAMTGNAQSNNYLTSGATAIGNSQIAVGNAVAGGIKGVTNAWAGYAGATPSGYVPPVTNGSNPLGYNGTMNNPSAYVAPQG